MNINAVKEFVKKDGIVFLTYGGFLTQALIAGMAESLEKETAANNIGLGDASNILTIFVELSQNIVNYSKTKEEENNDNVAEGLVIVGKAMHEAQQNYYIVSQNIVAVRDMEKITPKLEEILSMNRDELRKRYRELRKSGRDTHERGGGIGFYEIAKRSDKIEYKFSPINDKKFYFEFKSIVNIKAKE